MPTWSHAAKTHLRTLQLVQNRAARIITGHSRDTRITQLHEDLDLPYIHQVIDHQLHNFWTRLHNSTYPEIQAIGTSIPRRHTYKMPHPP